jgi:hypothetical protein
MLACIQTGIKESERHPEDIAYIKCMLNNATYRLPTCVEAVCARTCSREF